MKIKATLTLLICALFALNATFKTTMPKDGNGDWGDYLGGADRNHYSELTQINPENVSKLKIAWDVFYCGFGANAGQSAHH